MHHAPTGNHHESFDLLLQHQNIKVNIRNDVKDTALHCAIKAKNQKSIEQLLQIHDIDVNTPNFLFHTPLYLLKRDKRYARNKRIQQLASDAAKRQKARKKQRKEEKRKPIYSYLSSCFKPKQ